MTYKIGEFAGKSSFSLVLDKMGDTKLKIPYSDASGVFSNGTKGILVGALKVTGKALGVIATASYFKSAISDVLQGDYLEGLHDFSMSIANAIGMLPGPFKAVPYAADAVDVSTKVYGAVKGNS